MKKLMIGMLACMFILSGCMNPTSVKVVEDMYNEALMDDIEGVEAYFSEDFLEEYPIEELVAEVGAHVRYVGGTKLLNTVELTEKRLNEQIVEELNATYEDPWSFIVNDADDGEVMTWVVIRTSTHYEIVDGEEMTAEYYRKHVMD